MMVRIDEVLKGQYIRATEINDGDMLKILDEGKIESITNPDNPDISKELLTFTVMFRDKKRLWSPNRTTIKTLARTWGPETKNWINQYVQFDKTVMPVFGDMKEVALGKPAIHSVRD